MFTKENILKHTKILLFLLVFHFVALTFIKYQLGVDMHLSFLHSNIFNFWKDMYLIFIYFLIFVYAFKEGKINKTLLKNKLFISFFVLLAVSFLFTLFHFRWIKALIIGFKYDLWFLFPVLFFSLIDIDKKDLNKFYVFFLDLIKYTIVFSLFLEIIRFWKPDVMYLFGYGPIGDWKENIAPPLLYQTWFDGVQRMSWIFSGPNHLAFYFIAFWPILLLSLLNKKIHWIWIVLYLILLFGSLSRSWILAFWFEILLLSIFILKFYKQYRKIIITLFIGWFLWIWFIWTYLFLTWKYKQIILRWWSTKGHVNRAEKAIKWIKQSPIIWHGIWTAGPSAHYTWTNVVPESWFLQIFYELWILWWFVWFYFLFYLIYLIKKWYKITYPYLDNTNILKIALFIWIIWLLVQWVVLHSFEDSMIVIPLFILVWILISYNNKNDTKN